VETLQRERTQMAQEKPSRWTPWILSVLGFAVLFTMAACGGGSASSSTSTSTPTPPTTSNHSTGTVTVNGSAACVAGAATAAACTSLTVACSGIPNVNAILAISRPSGTPKGTIVFTSGGAGSVFLPSGADDYVGDGFLVVQVAWATDWADSGVGLTAAACRPATLFEYIFKTYQESSRSTGFCGQGSSGGGAQLMYSMTQYGLGDYFDHLVIAAGPATARLDYGCDSSLHPGAPPNLCPLLTDAPFKYSTQVQGFVNRWEGTSTCGNSNPPATDVSKWAADSTVTSNAQYSYPNTTISWFFCVNPGTVNESTGQGSFLIDAVNPKNGPPSVSCYSGGCTGEQVWANASALTDTESNMVDECVPNHQ
jgi:hypothetical protein